MSAYLTYCLPRRVSDNTQVKRRFVLPIGDTETTANVHKFQVTYLTGECPHPLYEFTVVLKLVDIDARPGMGMETDHVEIITSFGDDISRAIVGYAKLGVLTRLNHLVVTRANARINAYAEATIVSSFREA